MVERKIERGSAGRLRKEEKFMSRVMLRFRMILNRKGVRGIWGVGGVALDRKLGMEVGEIFLRV